MRLPGTYFELTDRRAAGTAGAPNVLIISVAKRIVPSSVRRNTVKRIARESWRAAFGAPQQTTSERRAELDDAAVTSVVSLPTAPGRTWLLRLKQYPGGKPVHVSRAARVLLEREALRRQMRMSMKAGQGGVVTAGAASTVSAPAAPLNFAAIKRLLRTDADRLFIQAARRGA